MVLKKKKQNFFILFSSTEIQLNLLYERCSYSKIINIDYLNKNIVQLYLEYWDVGQRTKGFNGYRVAEFPIIIEEKNQQNVAKIDK